MQLSEIAGVHYVEAVLPAVASGGNTAYEAIIMNPFPNNKAYVQSIELIPIEDITGDATNTNNWNVDLVGGTEIANKDFGAASDADRGVALAFTISGTAAQRLLAVGGTLLVEREEVGTQPARIHGHKIRVGFLAKEKTS